MWWGILFIIACLMLTYFVMRGHVRHAEQAIEVLRRQLARGEISREEFQNRLRALDA